MSKDSHKHSPIKQEVRCLVENCKTPEDQQNYAEKKLYVQSKIELLPTFVCS